MGPKFPSRRVRKIPSHTDTLPPYSPARNALLQQLRYHGSPRRRYRRRIHCQRLQRRQYFSLVTYHTALKFPPPSVHNTVYLHSAEFCVVLKTQLLELVLWRPYLFSQAWSTFATFLYTGRYMCDKSYMNQTIFSCGPAAQVSPVPPHCSRFYTLTQTQTHQLGRLHL